MIKNIAGINELLQKPMDRKQFLQQTAAITMMVAGGGIIVQSLIKGLGAGQDKPRTEVAASGYGGSAYGGTPK